MSHQTTGMVKNIQETCGGRAAVAWAAFASPEPSDQHRGVRTGPVAQASRMTAQQHSPWRASGRRISYAAADATRRNLELCGDVKHPDIDSPITAC
jgi:hypothetical protein